MQNDWLAMQALEWALEALDAAATDLTLAVVFCEEAAVRNDATCSRKPSRQNSRPSAPSLIGAPDALRRFQPAPPVT